MLQLVLTYTEIHLKKLYGPILWALFKFPEIPGTRFIKLGRMKGLVHLEPPTNMKSYKSIVCIDFVNVT